MITVDEKCSFKILKTVNKSEDVINNKRNNRGIYTTEKNNFF